VLAAVSMAAPPARQLALIDEALSVGGDIDPYLEALLLADRAMMETGTATSERAEARAVELAAAHNFARVSARLNYVVALRVSAAGRFDEAVLKLMAAHEQMALAGDSRRAGRALSDAAGKLVDVGQLQAGEALTQRALSYVRSIHDHQGDQTMVEKLIGIAIARNDDASLTTAVAALDPETLGGLITRSLRLERADDLAGAVALLPSPTLAGNVGWAQIIAHGHRARVRFNASDAEGARHELAVWSDVLTSFLRGPVDANTAVILPSGMPLVDEALVALGEDEIVRAVYGQLEHAPERRFCSFFAQGVDHLRGDLALRLGLVAEAEAHYRTGLAWGEREGVPVERGRCLLGLAEIAQRTGDSAGALQLIEQAVAIFEQANVPLYLRQAQARRAAIEATQAAEAPVTVADGAAAAISDMGTPRIDIPEASAATDPQASDVANASAATDEPAPISGDPARAAAPVFISYASVNRATAQALAERLAEAGVAVWLDKRSIAGGASWDAAIVDGIKSSRAVAVLVNPAAMQSRNVRQELRLALQYDKPVLPLLLAETVYPSEMEYVLAGRQWVEVFDQPADQWLPEVLHALALIP
jgi:tetratricopeptide (TPR) repeat protein